MAKKVELNDFIRIVQIFVKKNWIKIDGYEQTMECFGNLLEALNKEEFELIVELLDKYEWMSYNDYHTYLRKLLLSLSVILSNRNIKRLFLFPIVKPSDEDKTKSGHTVGYMIDAIRPSIPQFDNIDFTTLKNFKDLSVEKLKLEKDDFLLLIDDYIGSGKTLENALKPILSNETIKGKFGILTIAIQERTKTYLDDLEVLVFAHLILKRGISDENVTPILEQKHTIMQKIENRIHEVKGYRSGYEKSEALITLIRTPNNTFPIFWKELIYKGSILKAPFQRN